MTRKPDFDAAWHHAIRISSRTNNDDNRAAFLGALIARRCPDFAPGHICHMVNALQKLAGGIHRLAVQDCNHGLNPAQAKRMDNLKAHFHDLANACGFNARTGGDPRGACAFLEDPENEGAGDGWGSGWAVYK